MLIEDINKVISRGEIDSRGEQIEHVDSIMDRGQSPSSKCSSCSTRLNNSTWLNELVEKVRQVAYELHVYLGNGLLEKVYENGLKHRLEKAGLRVETQKEMKVFDEDGYEIGDYFADLVVEDELIVEMKAVRAIAPEHLAQTMNYLKITGKKIGLIINFGAYKFETRKVFAPGRNDSRGEIDSRGKMISRGEIDSRGERVEHGE